MRRPALACGDTSSTARREDAHDRDAAVHGEERRHHPHCPEEGAALLEAWWQFWRSEGLHLGNLHAYGADKWSSTDFRTAKAFFDRFCPWLDERGHLPYTYTRLPADETVLPSIRCDVNIAYGRWLGEHYPKLNRHQTFGDHPGAKNVHDIDSLQLVRMVKDLRDESKFLSGEVIKSGGPRFFIGAAANPFGDPFEWRPYRLAKKVAAGADFIQTQLIYDMARFREYMKRVVDLGLHEEVAILAGVGPLKSTGAAEYMRDKVPGMLVEEHYQ